MAQTKITGRQVGINIDDLNDVDTTTVAPVTNDVLTFTSGAWRPQAPTGGGSSVDTQIMYLSQVTTFGSTINDVWQDQNPTLPPLPSHFTYSDYAGEFTCVTPGLYELLVSVRVVSQAAWPASNYVSCGTNLVPTTGITPIGNNTPTRHYRQSSSNDSSLDASNTLAWVDRHLFTAEDVGDIFFLVSSIDAITTGGTVNVHATLTFRLITTATV